MGSLKGQLSTPLRDILGHPRITLGTVLSGASAARREVSEVPPPRPTRDPASPPRSLWPHSDPASLRLPQSLQNSSYNHFAAIYYLLAERLKEYRHAQPPARPGPARPQRPRSSDLSGFEVGEPSPSRGSALDCVPHPLLEIPCCDRPGARDAEPAGPQVTSPARWAWGGPV